MKKGIKYCIILAAMILVICIMVFVVFPKLDKECKIVDEPKIYSAYEPVCTIPVGEGCDIYYDYQLYSGIDRGPAEFKLGINGEFVILDPVSSQVLVYEENTLKLKFSINKEREPWAIHCTEDGYIINYVSDATYPHDMSEVYTRQGKLVETGDWYSPNKMEVSNELISFLKDESDFFDNTYMQLIKKDDYGNYYLYEKKTAMLEEVEQIYIERYISKYNSEGERISYAVYDYTGRDDSELGFIYNVCMDDDDNIYIMRCHRDNIVIYQVTLGKDDEVERDGRIEKYIQKANRYTIEKTEGEEATIQWVEVLEEYDYLEDREGFDKFIEGNRGYIMEVDEGEIAMELINEVKTYPYENNDAYFDYTYERKEFKLAEDVEVWAFYEYANRYGIIDYKDILNYERNRGYKVHWILYLNEAGEVKYIHEPYMP